jgi:hypothetical protein
VKRYTRDDIDGVLVWATTPDPSDSQFIGEWDVFFLPGCLPGCILGCSTGEDLGEVNDMDMDDADRSMYVLETGGCHPTMYDFIRKRNSCAGIYHAWACYSKDSFTGPYHGDDWYHAVDWYWQAPEYVMSGNYTWYALLDIDDPSEWYQAKRVSVKGPRQIELREYEVHQSATP